MINTIDKEDIYNIQAKYSSLEILDIIKYLLNNITDIIENLNDASDIGNDNITYLVLDKKYKIKKEDWESIYSFIDTIYFIKEYNKNIEECE